MRRAGALMCCAIAAVVITRVSGRGVLDSDQLKMLQDSGGWQYISVTDPDSGIQTAHTCFDGQPHPDACSGTLTLNPNHTFVQQLQIQGQGYSRHGTYEIDGSEIAFFDEFGTKDGPYQLTIDTSAKRLTMEMPQVHDELELQKKYKKDLARAQSGAAK